jgi:truncated hemoglobin YjbI
MTNEINTTHRDLWITLFSAVIAGSAATSGVPGALAERAREIADEAVQLIVSRWPDLPANYSGPRK